MANQDRGEMEIHIGDQTRTLRFKSPEVLVLEEMLGKDVLAFLAGGGGQTKFLTSAIIAGMSKTDSKTRLTPAKVAGWLDALDIDRDKLQREILYVIARGKGGEEAKRMVDAFDLAFNLENGEEAATAGPTP